MSSNDNEREVVVTGIGLITPLSACREKSWSLITDGKGGITAIERFDPAEFSVRIAGEIPDFDPTVALDRKEARRTDRVIQLAVAASREALGHSELEITDSNRDRIGVIIGTAMGGLETFESGVRTLIERGPSRLSPFFVPMTLVDMATGYVSIQLGIRGPNMATISACSSGGHAIGEAYETIRRGAADVIFAGGVEAPITPAGVGGFAAAGALSTRNDDPSTASRPFDKNRDGFVLGEGGAVLILEERKHAERRNATPIARVTGYGSTADAHHITQPADGGSGAARAMRIAIEEAGLSIADIDYINAHGTSTKLNDKFESQAIRSVFGDEIPAVSSTKGATGHLLGAAPAIEAAFSVLALRDSIIPPTINYETADPECLDNVTPGTARHEPLSHVMSNSFGFGGHNAVLIFSAP